MLLIVYAGSGRDSTDFPLPAVHTMPHLILSPLTLSVFCHCLLQFAQPVEKAIKTSPLSLNPTSEGAEVLVKLPRMTQETIEKMVKLVNMEAEQAKQSIRNARQKAMEAIKKAFRSGSADDKRWTEKEVMGFMALHTVAFTTQCWGCAVFLLAHICFPVMPSL